MNTNMVKQSDFSVRATVAEGVDSVLYVALSPETSTVTGAYFDYRKQTKAHAQAYDANARMNLEQLSRELISKAIH
jgi:hypothetical protein